MQEVRIQRCVQGIDFVLTHKRVKNINLRIRADGTVAVSAPLRCSGARVDAFVAEKAAWIAAAQQRMLDKQTELQTPCDVSPREALALFTQISDEIFPLFADVLQGQRPILKVRNMKTRWGVCKISARQITLSLRLAQKPRQAVEYVILHEYAHFVHGNHSPAFWGVVAQFLPDYKARRALLR